MRILIASERFHPSIGGVETVTRLLADALARAGHVATVVTNQEGEQTNAGIWQLCRRPKPSGLIKQYRRAEAVILQGPTVRLGWPLICLRRRALLIHHVRVPATYGIVGAILRKAIGRRARNAAVSRALAQSLPWPVESILPNPYDSSVFKLDKTVERTRDLLFVGRLVPEKGAHVLIAVLSQLRQLGCHFNLTVVGEGPERPRLERMAADKQVWDRVRFAGQITGADLARVYQRHRILVVPSEEEVFGLVALEGIACGCAVVGSNAGGLPEAIGRRGLTLPHLAVSEWAETLQHLLNAPAGLLHFQTGSKEHLAKHSPDVVADRYLKLINEAGSEAWEPKETTRAFET